MLTNCPECNHEISDKAHSCPNCGHPFDGREICQFCKGTGKNPKPTEFGVNAAYPKFTLYKFLFFVGAISTMLLGIFADKPFSTGLSWSFIVGMFVIGVIEEHISKFCPNCNGSGYAVLNKHRAKMQKKSLKLVPPNKKKNSLSEDEAHNTVLIDPLSPEDL